MSANPISIYLQTIANNLARGNATEHTHRPALKALLESLDASIVATNEPQHIVDVGAPDFIIERGKTPLGYVETKEVGENLDKIEKSEQLQRYRAAFPNLLLTDYLEFRWYVDGERRAVARVGEWRGKKMTGGDADAVAVLLQQFLAHTAPIVTKPKDLAERIAALAQLMRDVIEKSFAREGERGNLHEWFAAFQETLIPDLTPAQFADMFAQTIAYGLFAARANDPTPQDFSRMEAAFILPKTNPFLRKLFHEIAGPDLDPRVAWIADDLANLLARADMERVLKDFGKRTRREDPVVHFYETFLAAYDARLRKTRGVYYTPEPVVSYIVRSVDHLLRKEFGKANGLADPSVLVLDPAVGTATFLFFVVQQIYETLVAQGQQGAWTSYVAEKLLPRLFGFEILMAPYTIAHLKLGMQLKDLGYDFVSDERLGIYLTNTLEQAAKKSERLLAKFISDESDAAAEVKRDKPIMVVLGNPPYANFGRMNRGEWILNLLEDYKRGLREKKLNLDDDFIKFLRFGQWRIERSSAGILAFITNNTYIDGITHRRMRQSLLETFDDIYILDLHGSSKKKERAPDGSKDENVFDIQQGVAIALFVRHPRPDRSSRPVRSARVHHAELWGTRETKYAVLAESDVTTTRWMEIEPKPEQFFFVPKDFSRGDEYATGWSLKDIFTVWQNGIKTDRDDLFVDTNRGVLENRMRTFYSEEGLDAKFVEQYRIIASSSYDIVSRRNKTTFSSSHIKQCLYRPFDVRWLYYDPQLTSRPAQDVMRHMLAGDNISLLSCRQQADVGFQHVLCTTLISECCVVSLKTREITSVFPLYLYDMPEMNQTAMNFGARRVNFSTAFIAAMETRLGLKFVAEGGDVFKNAPADTFSFTPEDVFHYIYAILHSPTYRQRYAEFLKIDFPRIPLTRNVQLFRTLAAFGAELVALHLLESPALDKFITRFPVAGSNEVEKVVWAEEWQDASGKTHKGCVFINKTQYFEGIAPDVWNFHIGGYQVLDKWLKDRKGRVLSYDDITHYQKIVVALQETIRLMHAIDAAIPKWPIE